MELIINTFKNNIKNKHQKTNKNVKLCLKIQTNISKHKDIMDNLYNKLGRLTYNNINNPMDNYKDLISEIFYSIKHNENIILELENQVCYIKKRKVKADKVKTKKSKDNIKKVERSFKAPEPLLNSDGYGIYKFCSKCLIGNNPDADICVYCGSKFNN